MLEYSSHFRNALLDVLSQQQTLSNGQDKLQDSIEHLQEELEGRHIRDKIAAARTYNLHFEVFNVYTWLIGHR